MIGRAIRAAATPDSGVQETSWSRELGRRMPKPSGIAPHGPQNQGKSKSLDPVHRVTRRSPTSPRPRDSLPNCCAVLGEGRRSPRSSGTTQHSSSSGPQVETPIEVRQPGQPAHAAWSWPSAISCRWHPTTGSPTGQAMSMPRDHRVDPRRDPSCGSKLDLPAGDRPCSTHGDQCLGDGEFSTMLRTIPTDPVGGCGHIVDGQIKGTQVREFLPCGH